MISKILEEDHRKIGVLLEEFLNSIRKGKPVDSVFNRAKDGLHNHIYLEETFLFREVENEGNSLRIHGLEVEHGGIWKLLNKIGEYVTNGEYELAVDRLEGLIRVLETHNRAEEGTVYAFLEELDDSSKDRILHSDMQNPKAPEGWTCKVMRRKWG